MNAGRDKMNSWISSFTCCRRPWPSGNPNPKPVLQFFPVISESGFSSEIPAEISEK